MKKAARTQGPDAAAPVPPVPPVPLWPAIAVALPLFAAIVVSAVYMMYFAPSDVHVIDADDGVLVARGRVVYAQNCASCHGARLEGEPGWRVLGPDRIVHAPPQDETGHSWMHADEELFIDVKYGMAGTVPPGYDSRMTAFAGRLDDADIVAVLAFIKSRWPVGVRAYQAMLNPNQAGMPKAAGGGGWTLPADCGFEPDWSKPRGPTPPAE